MSVWVAPWQHRKQPRQAVDAKSKQPGGHSNVVQWTASQQPVLQPPQTKENKKRVQSRFDFPSIRLLMELLIVSE